MCVFFAVLFGLFAPCTPWNWYTFGKSFKVESTGNCLLLLLHHHTHHLLFEYALLYHSMSQLLCTFSLSPVVDSVHRKHILALGTLQSVITVISTNAIGFNSITFTVYQSNTASFSLLSILLLLCCCCS